MLSVKQGGIKYHFLIFGMTRPGIEPRSPGPLAKTLPIRQCGLCARIGPEKLDKGTERAGNLGTCQRNPDYTITKIGQNTEKSPKDLRRLIVTQTPVRNHQLSVL